MSDAPPEVPTEFQIYNSYEVDPIWQRKFSIVWVCVAGAFIVASLPHFFSSVRNGEAWTRISGIWEDLSGTKYELLSSNSSTRNSVKPSCKKRGFRDILRGLTSFIKALTLWTIPSIGIDFGQIILVVAYYVLLLCCITLQAELIDNPNRAGFMAIAQLPVVFLFAMKNSPISLLLGAGHGWEKLNIIHRWSGRGMVLSAVIHGALWIRNHREYGLQILGAQKETSGVAALSLLLAITLLSLKPIRFFAYEVFFILHIVAVVAFFITLCYHTIYIKPYIFPPLAFYGLDLLLRLVRYRVKDVTLIAPDNQFTIIRVENCDGGWLPGQHVRLRVFFGSRFLESHPLTIMSAPPQTSCLSEHTLYLGVRTLGDWSKSLNEYTINYSRPTSSSGLPPSENKLAIQETIIQTSSTQKTGVSAINEVSLPDPLGWSLTNPGARVQVLLEGPYGGSSVNPSEFSRVLLLAGGSGITFTLSLLDDLIGKCIRQGHPKGVRTRHIEFAWCVRSFGAIHWVSPLLSQILQKAQEHHKSSSGGTSDVSVSVHVTIYVTCLCDPESIPPIPNCDIIVQKPKIYSMLDTLLTFEQLSSSSSSEIGDPEVAEKGVTPVDRDNEVGGANDDDDGSLAVCSAGPESMAREVRNAVARLALRRPTRRTECHTEVYSI